MKAEAGLPVSNQADGDSNNPSKRTLGPGKRTVDSMYARQRRLEQRIERIEATLATTRRDVWRIEKKQQALASMPSTNNARETSDALPAGLFG